jgi:Mobilization protein NikA
MQSAKRIAAGPSFGSAGAPPGDEPAGGATGLRTAGPGGRMRRLPGGRRRVVFVRLSPDEEAWIVPKAAAEGLSVQRFLVESALPEGRPSLLARRALCREFLAVARDFHGACVNLNQLTHLAHVRRDDPSGADEVMAELRAGGRRILELAALLSARGGGSHGEGGGVKPEGAEA